MQMENAVELRLTRGPTVLPLRMRSESIDGAVGIGGEVESHPFRQLPQETLWCGWPFSDCRRAGPNLGPDRRLGSDWTAVGAATCRCGRRLSLIGVLHLLR